MFKSGLSKMIALAVALSLWLPTAGFAGVIQSNGFVGYYSLTPIDGNNYGNWELDVGIESDYDVVVSDNGSKLELVVGPIFSDLAFSIRVPAQGKISFRWSGIDPSEGGFLYSLDFNPIFPVPLEPNISVEPNQVFTLLVENNFSPDEITVIIDNFSGPYVIPEPSTFGLMTLAFAGFGLQYLWRCQKNMEARHRRRAAKLQSGAG